MQSPGHLTAFVAALSVKVVVAILVIDASESPCAVEYVAEPEYVVVAVVRA